MAVVSAADTVNDPERRVPMIRITTPDAAPQGTTTGWRTVPRNRRDLPPSEAFVTQRELGRALLWGGEPAPALEALAAAHRERPWDREVQHLLLDALFSLGRDAGDYPWTLEPVVVVLAPALLDDLDVLLRANGGPATALDLMLAVTERGYPTFGARELVTALERDPRFRVHRAGLAPECAVVDRVPLGGGRSGRRPVCPHVSEDDT